MTTGGPPPPLPGPGGPQGWPPAYGGPYPAYPAAPGGYPPYPAYPAAPGDALSYPGPDDPGGLPPGPAGRPPRWRNGLLAMVTVIALAAAGGGYAIYRTNHHTSTAQAGDCAVPDASVVTLQKKVPTEPTIEVPLTSGWTEVDLAEADWLGKRRTNMRGFFANDAIRQDDYTPDIAVEIGVTTEPDDIAAKRVLRSSPDLTRNRILDQDGCGTTLYLADFSQLDRFRPGTAPILGTTIVEVVEDAKGTKHVVSVNLATKHPDNPAYIAQRDALLKGLRVSVD